MRLFVPVFTLCRTTEDAVCWQLSSPRGRGIAQSASPFETVSAARDSIASLADPNDEITSSLTRTVTRRWKWQLAVAGTPVAREFGDHANRFGSEDARRKFLLSAPLADVQDSVWESDAIESWRLDRSREIDDDLTASFYAALGVPSGADGRGLFGVRRVNQ